MAQLERKLRIGIFGGTFDPVHNGHIRAAKAFREECGLDPVYVLPNCLPHMKEHRPASPADRLAMLHLAFDGSDGFVVSDLELKRGGVSYTVDTVDELRKLHPDAELFLYIGDDRLDHFTEWHDFSRLIRLVTVALADRTGRDVSEQVRELRETYGAKIVPLTFRALEASSTDRRNGDDTRCPEAVNRYIAEKGLYL